MNRKFLRERGITRREGKAGLSARRRCARSAAFRRIRCSGASPTPSPRRASSRTAFSWCSRCRAATTGSTRSCRTATTPTTGTARPSGSSPTGCSGSTTISRSIPAWSGFERLWQAGRLAIVHGCGYDNPSFSHFTSMAYWHTAAPNSGAEYGWVGRLADGMQPGGAPAFIVNVGPPSRSRSRAATTCRWCSTIRRSSSARASSRSGPVRARCRPADGNASRQYLRGIAQSALDACAGARGVRRLPDPDRLRPGAARSAQDRGADRGRRRRASTTPRFATTRSTRTCIRTPAPAPAHLYRRCDRRVHGRSRADRARRRRDRAGVLRVGRRVPENTNLGTDHGTAG